MFKFILVALFICSVSLASGTKDKNIKAKDREALPQKQIKELKTLLEANEKLHASFFEYNGELVEEEAKQVAGKIDAISNKEISKLLQYSKKKLLSIRKDSGRDKNNESYNLVSIALIYLVNKYDVGSEYNAYSCPMVKKKWIQNSTKKDKVHNPYAPEMPHCGSKDSHY